MAEAASGDEADSLGGVIDMNAAVCIGAVFGVVEERVEDAETMNDEEVDKFVGVVLEGEQESMTGLTINRCPGERATRVTDGFLFEGVSDAEHLMRGGDESNSGLSVRMSDLTFTSHLGGAIPSVWKAELELSWNRS